jgi:outer membrane protein assembly factor BamB
MLSQRRSSPVSPCLRAFGGALLLAASLWLGGCGYGLLFDKTGPMTPEERIAQFPKDHDAYAKLGYRWDWTGFPVVGEHENPVAFIEAFDDIVVVLDDRSRVTVLEAKTGARRWANELAGPLTKFVGIYRKGDRVYVSSEADLYILSADTGTLLDRQSLERVVSTPPVPVGNTVIYGTAVGEVYAHLVTASVKAWGNAATSSIEEGLALIGGDEGGGVIGAISQVGEVLMIDALSGARVGSNRIFAGVATSPVASDSMLYVASLDQSIYAFDPNGGRRVWRYRTNRPLRQQPVYHDGTLYCGLEGEGLYAFDSANGDVQWVAKDVTGTVLGITKGRLIVWNGSEATIIDPQRGDVIDRVPLDHVAGLSLDGFEGGDMYMVTDLGLVLKLVPRF